MPDDQNALHEELIAARQRIKALDKQIKDLQTEIERKKAEYERMVQGDMRERKRLEDIIRDKTNKISDTDDKLREATIQIRTLKRQIKKPRECKWREPC
jgi:predicted  nucleic acid-binding Zn-ribbon protein